MKHVGYAHIIYHAGIAAIEPAIVAEVRSVTRKEVIGNTVAVPVKLAPEHNDLLGHVLFALKHEGVNLQVLAQALPRILEPKIPTPLRTSLRLITKPLDSLNCSSRPTTPGILMKITWSTCKMR